MTYTLADQTFVGLVAMHRDPGPRGAALRADILTELCLRGRGDLVQNLTREYDLEDAMSRSLKGPSDDLLRRARNLGRWIDGTASLDRPTNHVHATLGRNLVHALRTPESGLTICGLNVHAPAHEVGTVLIKCALCIPECAR